MARSLGVGQRWPAVVALLDEMRVARAELTASTLTAVISVLARGRQWQLAMSAFGSFVEEGLRCHAVPLRPDVTAFNALVAACEKGRRWRHALSLLASGPSACRRPPAGGCERGSQFDEGGAALWQPDVVSFNCTISALEGGPRRHAALGLVESGWEGGGDSSSSNQGGA
mmetsp:Transcript_40546/g.108180  ORF Transcript_40546/g.108180 Transcript_40546/m.108180 type:complete len:170 (-) Transcript_40546:519-1028(-)